MKKFILAVVMILMVALPSVAAEKPIDVYLLRGQGGVLTSPGVDSLGAEIQLRYPQARVTVWDWNEWQSVLRDIDKRPSSKHVVIGYSLGANASTWIADATKTRVDLLVALDPSIWTVVRALKPKTVRQALLVKNDNPFNLVGLASLTLAPGFDSRRLSVMHTVMPHLLVDVDAGVRARVLSAVAKALRL